MGRGFKAEAAVWAGKEDPQAEPDNVPYCGICSEPVNENEEYLQVFCNKCDQCYLHRDCASEFLDARASEKTNSMAVQKYKIKARKRPTDLFEQRMPCPSGIYALSADGGRMAGSKACRNKHGLIGACPGFTIGAEMIKPAKEPPAPLPQIVPVRVPKERGKEEKEAAKVAPVLPKGSALTASSASSQKHSTGKARAAAKVPAPGAGPGVRLLGASHSTWTTVGAPAPASKKAWQGRGVGPPPDRLRLPPGAPRPPELTMCKHQLEDGECRIFSCQYCHSEEEQRRREKEWVVRQEARRAEARRQEAAAQAAAVARLEEEQEVLAQVASIESLNQPYVQASLPPTPIRAPSASGLRLTTRSLALLRTFKRAFCFNSLLEMGFLAADAGAAADAAAGDLERAAQLLMDGTHCSGATPVDVHREEEELSSVALALGIDADGVEAQLALAGGNWEVALESMQGITGAGFAGSAATPEDLASLAPSEPNTPSIGGPALPPWATDTSSLSIPSPGTQSPRAAAASAVAAVAWPSDLVESQGVLSLADFSSGPDTPADFSFAGSGAGAAEQATPTAARFGGPLPVSSEALSVVAGSADGYSDGFAAGMAAAAAMRAASAGGSDWEQAVAVPGADVTYPAWVPVAEMDRPAPAEEEIDELMHMLGIA